MEGQNEGDPLSLDNCWGQGWQFVHCSHRHLASRGALRHRSIQGVDQWLQRHMTCREVRGLQQECTMPCVSSICWEMTWVASNRRCLSGFFCSKLGNIKTIFNFSSCKMVQRKQRSVQGHGPRFIPWVSESLTLFSLAGYSVGIYSTALFNIFLFSEYLFSITALASLFGLCWRLCLCVSNVAGREAQGLCHTDTVLFLNWKVNLFNVLQEANS